MASTKDMTQGKPAKLILTFAFPLLLSTLFQQFYGMVDTIVVGRGVGVSALAAVGSTGYITFFVLGFITGLTYGFSALFAQRFGANDIDGLRKAIAASLRLSMLLALGITLLSTFGAGALLSLLSTPADIFADAQLYLVVVFAAIPIALLYNLFAAVLRSVGNSRTPLIAMICSSILNIVLDLLFVFSFSWGVFGVALATDIAQALSCFVCYLGIRKSGLVSFRRVDFAMDRTVDGQLLKLGLPTAFMSSITAIGGMLLQGLVNGFGSVYVAGYTAAMKPATFLEQPAAMLGTATSVFVGQNLGAGKPERVRKGVRTAIGMSLLLCTALGLLMYLCRDLLVGLFIRPEDLQAVLPISGTMLTAMSLFLPVLGLLFIFRNALQGMGDAITPMFSGFLELLIRMAVALALTGSLHFLGICIAEVSAWTGAALLLAIAFYIRCAKINKARKPHSLTDSAVADSSN
ncbi:MAG: MATE family efflux transporter [Clostridia bacterium]